MKRIMMILTAILMTCTYSFATVEDDSAGILVKMKIMAGYPDGTLKLENNITRAEFCTLIIKMLGQKSVEITTKTKFKDLKEEHWAYNTIMTATQLGYLRGYEDNTFRPSNNITYAEVCSILINILGYKDELTGKWPTNVTEKAKELKLDENAEAEAAEKMTRGNVAVMLINAMDVEIK